MIRELDMVVISRDIPEYGLVQGDIGVILHIYDDANGIEVEFVSGEGNTVGVMTLTLDDVRTIKNDEILHVRELNSA